MPDHILALLKCARILEHFFVPLIFNDSDDRWYSTAFWDIPSSLPPTLRSFRGFDAQTPLRFVHQCIEHLPNIEEFHIVLYFGSHHPDFIACRYTGDTLRHLAAHCHRLRSFEGYFDSTHRVLDGIEQMVAQCHNLQAVGLLFHPDVTDQDITVLIEDITRSIVCRPRQPAYSRLTENPNQHVQLRVVEISFSCSAAVEVRASSGNGDSIRSDTAIGSAHSEGELHGGGVYGGYHAISSEHLKSLDEIETSEEEDEDLLDGAVGLDERSPTLKRNRQMHNHNHHYSLSGNDNDNESSCSQSEQTRPNTCNGN